MRLRKADEQRRRWENVGLAWLIALGIVMVAFGFWHVTPFGHRNLLMSDMGTQYIPLLTALQHALRYQTFHLFSFSLSLGSNVVPTVAYYLLSPFNIIVLAFSAANVPIAASVIIMVKIATIAATMAWFLQDHFLTSSRVTIVFALAFSLSGFVAVDFFDLMWLDALIVLPLVVAGIDRLVRAQRLGMFYGWLLVSMVTNYYLGYMMCLFSILYFGYTLFNQWGRPGLESKQAGYGRLGWFTLTGALSGLSAAAILLPTGLGMLLTAKGTANAINFRPVPEFGLEFFTQFGLGATNFTQRLMHAPTVFVSSAVALLVLTFFVNPMIGRRKKFATVTLLGMLFLGMWLRVFNTFWHLMQAPAGFPFRNVFFFSFVMVMVGYEAWIAEPRQISQGWQWVLPIGQVMIMVLGAGMMPLMRQLVSGHSPKLVAYYAKIQQVHWGSLWIGCLYVIVTALVLFMTQRALRQWTLAMLVTSELGGNFVLSMSTGKFGDQVKYAQAYAEENRHMAGVNDPDGQLYRVQNTNSLINQAYQTTYNNYNDSLLFNFHGIAGYSSTLNDRTRQTLHQLGLFSDNVRRVSDVGLTPVTEALLGVKSTVSLTPTRSQTTATTGYSGMGFAVPAGLTRVPLTMNASQNQEAILQAIRPSATHDVVPAKQLGDQVKVVHRVGGKVTKYHYHHVMTLMAKATGPVYLWAPNGETKYSTMTVNGHRVKPTSNANGHTALIKLGTFKRGQTMIVRVATKYATAIYHLEAVSFNQVQVNRALQMLKQNQLTATTKTSRWQTVINGQVTGTTRKDHLYLALADDTGWHVMINGQHVRTQRTLGGFMSVPITPGHNRVRLTYQVPGGRSGWLLSGIGVLDFSGLALWSRSKRKHKH